MALSVEESVIQTVKDKVNEIDTVITESLAIQTMGGYHVRNLAIELKAVLEGILPTPAEETDEVEPDGTLGNPLQPEGDNIQPVNE